MSVRALKKLEAAIKEENLLNRENSPDNSGTDDEDDDHAPANRFCMLDTTEDSVEENSVPVEIPTSPDAPVKPKVEQSKKKRKKKNKLAKANNNEPADLVEILEELDAMDNKTDVVKVSSASSARASSNNFNGNCYLSESELFYIDHRCLLPENELRKKLGARAVDGSAAADKRRRGRPKVQGGGSKLVQPKTSWPIFGKTGLSMKHEESLPGGVNRFSFEHGPAYQTAQFAFWEAVDSMMPDGFVAILREFPYHIDTVLQLSEVMRNNEDYQAARDLIERAIYGCECAFHPLFSVNRNSCRLDYCQSENRPFFLSLFRHMTTIAQRGCSRTALEFCKLIYSLDPSADPLGMLLMIDSLALKSQEFDYLINLYDLLEISRNLSQLPSFGLSVALAMHLKAGAGDDAEGYEAKAVALMEESILKFPTFLIPLLDRLNVEPDKAVASHPLFSAGELLKDSIGLKLLISVFIARNHAIWKEPENIAWLEERVRGAMERQKTKEGKTLVAEWREIRKTRYVGTPRNIMRHVLVSELTEAMAALPQEIRDQSVLQYDPLPPNDTRRNYEKPNRPERRMNDSYLATFFRSMLPDFNPETHLFVDEEGAAAVEGAAGGGRMEFQQSVQQLMDAVRDLMGNIQPVPAPREDGHGEEDEIDPDDEWGPD